MVNTPASAACDNTAIHNGNLPPTIFFDVSNGCVLHIEILLVQVFCQYYASAKIDRFR
jgi:hypothetical protein